MKTWLCLRREWLLPLLLALAGCGPGVGGTGTGEQSSALSFFGARPASLCTASFAGQLKCPSRVVIGPTPFAISDGSENVVWADDPVNARVSARISGSDVEFEATCESIRFTGTWGTKTSEGAGRFYGYYVAENVGFAVPGTLMLQAANGDGLAFVLQDATGLAVFGPRLLQKVAGEPAVLQCR